MIEKGWYKHFKGGRYFVVGMAIHTETKEDLVIYYGEQEPSKLWARPINMFLEEIDYNKKRFTKEP